MNHFMFIWLHKEKVLEVEAGGRNEGDMKMGVTDISEVYICITILLHCIV